MENLCTSCLCTGRKLYFLSETGFELLYSQILNEIAIYNISELCIRICWECKALLRKVARFKEQVKTCYMELLQYVQWQNTEKQFSKFSHLQSHHNEIISYPLVTVKEEVVKEEVVKEEEFSFLDDSIAYVEDEIPSEEALDTKVEAKHYAPETFVNTLNMVEIKKTKNGKKADKKIKQKTKNKPKKNKQKASKNKIKLKKTNVSQTDDLSTHTADTLLDSTEIDYKNEDSTIEDSTKGQIDESDNIQSDKAVGDTKLEMKITRNCKIKNTIPKVVNEPLTDKPVCAECGKTFSSRKTYRYHLNVLHKGQNRYPCPRCGKVYQWKSNLGRHMRSHKARDSGELYCETCDKRFASVATFRQHLRISRRHVSESEFSFMCNECDKKFVNKTRLRDHIDWEHLKKIKFKCQLCNKPFKCHTSLYVHMQNVHRSKDKKDNLCHVCGKSYQNAAKLKYHIVAMHTTETPYQCQQCNAAFGWYSSLYRHVREVHYKLKVQPKKSKKQKKSEMLPSLLPPVLPTMHHSGPV